MAGELENVDVVLSKPLTDLALSRINSDAQTKVSMDPTNRKTTLMMREGWKEKVNQEVERLREFALKQEASNLNEMLLLSSYQRERIYLVGDAIELIKNDPAFKSVEQEALGKINKGAPEVVTHPLLGGDRAPFKELFLRPWNPQNQQTIEAIANPLTWMLRHVDVIATPSFDEDGNLSVQYEIIDQLDLSPHEGEGFSAYNIISAILGSFYHGLDKNTAPIVSATFTVKY